MENSLGHRFKYAALGFPLAFLGLPLYLYLPKYFSDTHGISLATIGVMLLLLRIADMIVDPVIGYISDRHLRWRNAIMLGGGLLALVSYAALYWPALVSLNPALWFVVLTGLLYLGYSTLIINYYALGLTQADSSAARVSLSVAREGAVLFGTLLAALLPAVIQQAGSTFQQALQATAVVYAVSLLFGLLLIYRLPHKAISAMQSIDFKLSDFIALLRMQPSLRWLFTLFFVNALPVAITSTIFLFYVDDVLGRGADAGYFLALYFAVAAVATPLWSRLAHHWGRHNALLAGMVLAVISFGWAYGLTPATADYFYIICALSGLALGADMVLLPVLLADALEKNDNFGGISFAIWQALGKWSLALAAGIMLPLLAMAGYQPEASSTDTTVVSVAYALAPCVLKLLAIALVIKHRRSLLKQERA